MLKKAAKPTIVLVCMTVIVLSVLVLVAAGMGWKFGTVVSGSMEPVLGVGEFAVAQPVDPCEVQTGDIIAFEAPDDPDTIITHRVTDVVGEGDSIGFKTKGDANHSTDSFVVPADNVEGKIVFHAPYIGYVISFGQTPFGLAVFISLPLTAILIVIIRWRRSLRLPMLKAPRPQVTMAGESDIPWKG